MVIICEEMNQLKCNVDAETMNFMIKDVLFVTVYLTLIQVIKKSYLPIDWNTVYNLYSIKQEFGLSPYL